MANAEFNWSSIVIRLFFALILVFSSYNPEGYSYYHWAIQDIHTDTALKVFLGVVLVIGWVIYIRATFHSLGIIGILLAIAFFATLVWVIVDWGWIPTDNVRVLSYIVLIITSWILTTGISWSFIRRKISGQYDVVESEEEHHD